MEVLTISLFGRLTVSDSSGQDLSPHGQRARGIIAMLATTPGHNRSRDWLKARLWSDRASPQASGSLRTAISEIRRALGRHSEVLGADRNSVWLEPTRIRIDRSRQGSGCVATNLEAFEGLDIADPEFEHWIRDLRQHIEATHQYVPQQSQLEQQATHHLGAQSVVVVIQTEGGRIADIAAQLALEQIRSGLWQIGEFSTIVCSVLSGVENNASLSPSTLPTVRLLSIQTADGVFLSTRIQHPLESIELWSTSVTLPLNLPELHQCDVMVRLVLKTVEEIAAFASRGINIQRSSAAALALARAAQERVFLLDRPSLIEADRLFCQAYEQEPRGRYLACRAFLRNLAGFVHQNTSFLETRSMHELTEEALRQDPESGLVQAIASQLDYVQNGDLNTAIRFARLGADTDPSNPLVIALLSNMLAATGQVEEGYQTARRAVLLSSGTRHRYFYEHFACMAAAAREDYTTALSHARMALRLRSDFVSTRRYEVALSLQLGDVRGAERSVVAMRQIEPDFSPSSMLADDYPVVTMKRLPLMAAVGR